MAEMGVAAGAEHLGAAHERGRGRVSSTALSAIGVQKLGQPVPQSNFVGGVEQRRAAAGAGEVRRRLWELVVAVNGRSVPLAASPRRRAADSWARHSASVLWILSVIVLRGPLVCPIATGRRSRCQASRSQILGHGCGADHGASERAGDVRCSLRGRISRALHRDGRRICGGAGAALGGLPPRRRAAGLDGDAFDARARHVLIEDAAAAGWSAATGCCRSPTAWDRRRPIRRSSTSCRRWRTSRGHARAGAVLRRARRCGTPMGAGGLGGACRAGRARRHRPGVRLLELPRHRDRATMTTPSACSGTATSRRGAGCRGSRRRRCSASRARCRLAPAGSAWRRCGRCRRCCGPTSRWAAGCRTTRWSTATSARCTSSPALEFRCGVRDPPGASPEHRVQL